MKNTKTRYIPAGYTEYAKSDFGIVYKQSSQFIAMFFVGKQSEPVMHYRFSSADNMDKKINTFFADLKAYNERKLKRKEERKNQLEAVKVGDMLSCSWGYEQTNVDFYQVVERKGKQMKIRPIAQKMLPSTDFGAMASWVAPEKDKFIGEPITKTSLSMEFGSLSPVTENDRRYCSWYA
jgi:hypothetical protein